MNRRMEDQRPMVACWARVVDYRRRGPFLRVQKYAYPPIMADGVSTSVRYALSQKAAAQQVALIQNHR